jgi:hypothetical protein
MDGNKLPKQIMDNSGKAKERKAKNNMGDGINEGCDK